MIRSLGVAALAALAAVSLVGCGSDDKAPAGGSESSAAAVKGDVTVFAAASLTEAFTELGKKFESDHPGTKVTFNFAGSSALSKQIDDGAPADVFASAAPKNMDEVTDAGGASGNPTIFVRNKLMIAVPAGNPGGIKGLADFGDASKKIALCAPEVPCGAAAEKALGAAGITAKPDTLEQDVKAVLTKVSLGEVDAALVYTTDVKAAGDKVEGIDFPEADKAINDYPIVALKNAPNAEGAKAFVDLVLSADGEAVLTKAGFEKP
jgi:molybdate transport system substrate-binding protein